MFHLNTEFMKAEHLTKAMKKRLWQDRVRKDHIVRFFALMSIAIVASVFLGVAGIAAVRWISSSILAQIVLFFSVLCTLAYWRIKKILAK